MKIYTMVFIVKKQNSFVFSSLGRVRNTARTSDMSDKFSTMIEKQLLLLNGWTISIENLFVVKPEKSHKNSIYLLIF